MMSLLHLFPRAALNSKRTESMEDKSDTNFAAEVLETAPAEILALPFVKHVPLEDIPPSKDLFSGQELQEYIDDLDELPLHLLVVGDIMLEGRAKKVIAEHGSRYPFEAVAPVLKRAAIILGNLEGPLAAKVRKHKRNFSYRVKPESALWLAREGFSVLTLANNHLVDCGRQGVIETIDALKAAGINPLGAGCNDNEAHVPVIRKVGSIRIGLLGYYWNKRCAATKDRPGSAMDSAEELKADIGLLRQHVDRIVVTLHWGIPYEREPLSEDRIKARFAIDCGADAVVSHHAHVVQPFEVYRNCPIFYSIGNFTFGSGNSRGEGIMVGIRFGENKTDVDVYPLYVKNRDPRVNYQPKVLRHESGNRILCKLRDRSGDSGMLLQIESGRGRLELPWNRK
jgi:poly-gamma-glutamate capsule biosynthesis protein CapA/YwtB (metallophosphatase superfamily)